MISPDIVVRKMASSCHAFLESRCGLGTAKLKINPIAMVMTKGSNLAPFQLGKDNVGNLRRLEGWEGGGEAAMALVGRPSGPSWGGENVARAAISGLEGDGGAVEEAASGGGYKWHRGGVLVFSFRGKKKGGS